MGNHELNNLALGNLKRTQGELVFGHHLQIIRLNGRQKVLLAKLIEDVGGHDLAELLAQEVHGLPMNPFGAVGL